MEKAKEEYNRAIEFYQKIINAFKADLTYYELLIQRIKPKSILELGCGSGRLFPSYLDKVEKVVGIDISEEMLRKASEVGGNSKTNIEVILGDITNFSIEDKFDLVIISNSLLKHIKESSLRRQVLRNAQRHLSESGVISIDHASYLYYESQNTDWVKAEQSVIADWIPNVNNLLNGYEWNKTILEDEDIINWRYIEQGEVKFSVKFSTYIYKIEDLILDLEAVGLKYQKIYSDYLHLTKTTHEGNRFIAIASPLIKTLIQVENNLKY